MFFHVGIDPDNGRFAIYNEKTKETINCKITKKLDSDSRDEDIIEMFVEIKAKINGKLGFVCIYLEDKKYGNEIRKNFIKNGKSFGFLNIQIINSNMVFYLEYITQINRKPKNGDIIWVIEPSCFNNYCYIFEITNSKAKMIKQVRLHRKNDLIKKVKEVMKENKISGDSLNPDILIYEKEDSPNFENLKNLFPKCEYLEVQYRWGYENASLIKARIMAKDPEVINSDVEMQVSSCRIEVYANEKTVLFFDKYQVLPLEKSLSLNAKEEYVFKIYFDGFFRDKIKLVTSNLNTPTKKIKIKMDLNRIITIDYFENINELAQITINPNPFLKSYMIPQKLKTTDGLNVVGIDLGTSRCFAAVNRRNGIEIIALDNTGERYLPSYVSFKEKNEHCGQIVVNRLQNNSKSSVFDAKRIIGRFFSEIKVDKTWPFEIISKYGQPLIKIEPTYNYFMEKSPEDIAAVLLKHIKQKAEELQNQSLNEVVITVPAAYNERQKCATIKAGKLAGWKLIHLFPEPIAAAFAYFVDRPIPNEFTMLLFDFGGGTLDVCLMKVSSGKLNVIQIGGDANLGGRDFDNILFNHFSEILKSRYGINVNVKERLKYLLMQKCMAIKHTLSATDDDLLDTADFNQNIDETLKITRQEFEKMSYKTLNKVKDVIVETLSTSNYISPDIHKVLLVGGSSRMPMIRELLRKMFSKAEHCCEENPDEVVAIGAAYYAYYLQEKGLKEKQNLSDENNTPPTPPPRRLHSLMNLQKTFEG